jgi:hypothetical protein
VKVTPAVVAIWAAAAILYTSGIRRELPFSYEGDERLFVGMAVNMAAHRDPNPHWFGHPGSTLVYPLAGIYRLRQAGTSDRLPRRVDEDLLGRFRADPGDLYALGRALSVAYGLLSLPLVFLVGRRVYSDAVAVGGVWLAALSPLVMTQSQLARTDSAGMFFGLLALWACLRLVEQSSASRQMAAGVAIGLAIASRYFLVALVAVLLVIDAARLRREGGRKRKEVAEILAGLASVAVGFVASSPYVLGNFATVLHNLGVEGRPFHGRVPSFSPAGNLLWYLGTSIPGALTWPVAVMAALGFLRAVGWGTLAARALCVYVGVFLAGICALGMHWARWVVPILPVLSLLAADGVRAAAARLAAGWSHAGARAATVLAWLAVSLPAGYDTVRTAVRQARPTTRLLAREWLLEHLPPGARVATERLSAPLHPRQRVLEEELKKKRQREIHLEAGGEKRFDLMLVSSLGSRGWTPHDYARSGYGHVVASAAVYQRYRFDHARFPRQAAFYEDLARHGRLLRRFEPSTWRAGPRVDVYDLTGARTPATAGP